MLTTAASVGFATLLTPALGPHASAAPAKGNGKAAFVPHAATKKSAAPLSTVAAAAKAGIKPGQAYMGWYAKATGASARSSATVDTLSTRSSTVSAAAAASTVNGMDVSSWQGSVAWRYHLSQGRRFAYVKATEGLGYRNPYFNSQYSGSYNAGLIRGAYHFALPNTSGGVRQARYFVSRGGGWSSDGKTLPGVLDIEYNPYGATCYNRTPAQLSQWVYNFTREYRRLTGRDAVIYTTADWWRRCLGNSTRFSQSNPLWIARYASSPGTLPGGWRFYTFWQYTSSPYDKNRFSASLTQLRRLARG